MVRLFVFGADALTYFWTKPCYESVVIARSWISIAKVIYSKHLRTSG